MYNLKINNPHGEIQIDTNLNRTQLKQVLVELDEFYSRFDTSVDLKKSIFFVEHNFKLSIEVTLNEMLDVLEVVTNEYTDSTGMISLIKAAFSKIF